MHPAPPSSPTLAAASGAPAAPGLPTGLPRRGQGPAPASQRLQAAFVELVAALRAASGAELEDETALRATALWQDHLLAGEGQDLAALVGAGLEHAGATPVLLRGVGVHLSCPHHLTVALGEATLAYLPGGRVAGLGNLAAAVQASCARLVLQEDAAAEAAAAVVQALGARAAVVCITARHPCYSLLMPRSHAASVVSWGSAGAARDVAMLRQLAGPAPQPT